MATISLPVATILCCDYGSDTGGGGNLRENNINRYMSGEYVIAPGEIKFGYQESKLCPNACMMEKQCSGWHFVKFIVDTFQLGQNLLKSLQHAPWPLPDSVHTHKPWSRS